MSTHMVSENHSPKTIKKHALSYTVSKNVSNVLKTTRYIYLSLTQISLPNQRYNRSHTHYYHFMDMGYL
jgi:hypothetical protein